MEDSGTAIGIGLVFVLVVIGVISFGLWLWSIIHCVKNKQLTDSNRIIGIVLIVVLGLLGSLIYLFLPRDQEPVEGALPPSGG
jgi:ABC-type Mn2+/Zn2+ transport system permease subunit